MDSLSRWNDPGAVSEGEGKGWGDPNLPSEVGAGPGLPNTGERSPCPCPCPNLPRLNEVRDDSNSPPFETAFDALVFLFHPPKNSLILFPPPDPELCLLPAIETDDEELGVWTLETGSSANMTLTGLFPLDIMLPCVLPAELIRSLPYDPEADESAGEGNPGEWDELCIEGVRGV